CGALASPVPISAGPREHCRALSRCPWWFDRQLRRDPVGADSVPLSAPPRGAKARRATDRRPGRPRAGRPGRVACRSASTPAQDAERDQEKAPPGRWPSGGARVLVWSGLLELEGEAEVGVLVPGQLLGGRALGEAHREHLLSDAAPVRPQG